MAAPTLEQLVATIQDVTRDKSYQIEIEDGVALLVRDGGWVVVSDNLTDSPIQNFLTGFIAGQGSDRF
jgi:hypothetical protein